MHVLIIDDTPADHDIIEEYLYGNEYIFHHAYSASEGLKMYQEYPIDCVLLDYHMPGQDGLAVLKQITDGGRIVPVIMMTGDGDELVAVTAMKLGSQDYLPKKVLTASALKRAVERASERTEMLRQMEQYRVDLERSNRDLEQFATIVAHDLKSPLRAISQHLSFIRNKQSETMDEKTLTSLGFAVDGAARMSNLIDALFEYARIGFAAPSFNVVDMEAVLRNVLQDLSTTIQERNAQITHDPLPEVFGDKALLSELMQNLLGNALKYCTEKPCIHIAATQEENGWRFGVRDNGIGIPDNQQQKIFMIFRRLHQDEYPGIGLGLAVCDRIIKLHGGKIGVTSEPGKGSEFYFTLEAPIDKPVAQPEVAYG